jgi:hypothetical protein
MLGCRSSHGKYEDFAGSGKGRQEDLGMELVKGTRNSRLNLQRVSMQTRAKGMCDNRLSLRRVSPPEAKDMRNDRSSRAKTGGARKKQ